MGVEAVRWGLDLWGCKRARNRFRCDRVGLFVPPNTELAHRICFFCAVLCVGAGGPEWWPVAFPQARLALAKTVPINRVARPPVL